MLFPQCARVLAEVAYQFIDLVEGLSIYSARRQSARVGEDTAELDDYDAAWRIVAWGGLDVCGMGRLPRIALDCASGDGAVLATGLGRDVEQVSGMAGWEDDHIFSLGGNRLAVFSGEVYGPGGRDAAGDVFQLGD